MTQNPPHNTLCLLTKMFMITSSIFDKTALNLVYTARLILYDKLHDKLNAGEESYKTNHSVQMGKS